MSFADRNSPGKALIAMSGGVDSSVAAALMQEAGYECIGVTMKLRPDGIDGFDTEDAGKHTCCSLEDAEDAGSVCRKLGIPFYVFNFREDFSRQVIDRFVHAYEAGETPNPCIDCNRYMKFERLYRRARELGCDFVVTGHYARIGYDEASGRWQLKKSLNTEKDQSYVLCFMTQEQLAHTRFPLGEYGDKEAVRDLAQRMGFVTAHKQDSQDICFVPDGDYASFIERYTGKTYPPGSFVERETGKILGEHRGIIRYTIGQRRGLGLALPAPLYVCGKDMERNQVLLSPDSGLYKRELLAGDFNWISRSKPQPGEEIRVTAKPRYRAKEAPATATLQEDGTVLVLFDEPQRAITPGQAVVLYEGDLVTGGGIIQ